MTDPTERGPAALTVFRAPTVWSFTAVIVALMITGSLLDFAISEALLDEASLFGRLGATFGWFPSALALGVAGTLLVMYSRAGPPVGKRAAWSGAGVGGVLVVGSAAVCVLVPPHYWNASPGATSLPTVAWVLVGVLVSGAGVGIAYWAGRGASSDVLLKVALVLITVVASQSAVIFAVKLVWLRPRMRLVVEDLGVVFEPWWSVGYPGIGRFLEAGVPVDDFKSFPSAHTGNAAVALSFVALGALSERARAKMPFVLALAVAWAAAVALSRIVVGAHFLSDTTVGFGVTFFVAAAVYWVVFVRGCSDHAP